MALKLGPGDNVLGAHLFWGGGTTLVFFYNNVSKHLVFEIVAIMLPTSFYNKIKTIACFGAHELQFFWGPPGNLPVGHAAQYIDLETLTHETNIDNLIKDVTSGNEIFNNSLSTLLLKKTIN